MGNESTSLTDKPLIRTYRSEQWLKQTLDHNGELWRNKYSHQLVKIYPLQKIPSIEDMNRYQLRSTYQYLVKIFNIAMYQHPSVCNSNQSALLLVEHIPLTLNDILSLDLQQALTVLHSSFRGFHTIQSLFQLVDPHPDLIGFNEEGKTKVWLNRQLNNNFTAKQSKTSELNQFSRVVMIINMVEKKIPGNHQFYRVKEEILQHRVNYFQASIIVEQFAFRQELSLKRYVRTDLLTRQKSESHRRNTTMSTLIPTQRSNFGAVRRFEIIIHPNQLQKNSSWDRLTPVRTSYIMGNQPLRPSQQINSRISIVGSSPSLIGSKSIPKITFNGNNEAYRSPKASDSNRPKIVFGSPKAEQKIVYFSARNSFCQKPAAPIPQQQNNKSQKKEQDKVQQKKQKLDQNTPQIQNNQQRQQNQIAEASQPTAKDQESPAANLQSSQIKRSIIDECEKYLEDSKTNSPEKQTEQVVQIVHTPLVQDIQVSGMFRQIAERQYKDQEEHCQVIQEKVETQGEIGNKGITLQIQSQNKQLPINFESFAVEKIVYVQNVSFAPSLVQNNAQTENMAATTKSLDLEEKQEQHESEQVVQSQLCESDLHVEEPPKKNFRLVESEQKVQNKQTQQFNDQPLVRVSNSRNMSKNPLSFQLQQQFSAICRQQKPFYEEYTPVESKFDIVIKRDSVNDKDREPSERSNHLSAFGNVEEEEGYDKNIKNKFRQMFPTEELRINRISSEYQTKTKKNHDSSREAKQQIKANKISHINEGTEEDFLDINHLQKTLEMKCSKKVHKKSDEFQVSKLEEKLLKFSSSRGQIGSQNTNRQSTQTHPKSKDQEKSSNFGVQRKENNGYSYETSLTSPAYTSKQSKKQISYKQTLQLNKDYRPAQYKQTLSNRYKTYNQQYDPVITNDQKYNAYSYNRYPTTGEKKLYGDNLYSYNYQPNNDIYDRYASTSNINRYTSTLPQNSKIKKQSDTLLEQRYQKYVKQAKNRPTITKQKSVDNFSKTYQAPQQTQPQRGKRISYDNLRQFLWN